MSICLNGSDTLEVNGRILSDFADGDTVKIDIGADISKMASGANGNVIGAKDVAGNMGTMEIRVLQHSPDDKFLQNIFNIYQNKDTATFKAVVASFTKRSGDGQGNVSSGDYVCEFGLPKKQVDVVSNVNGSTEQCVSIHRFQFGFISRVIS